jgi:AcrR family transcriptional regulator
MRPEISVTPTATAIRTAGESEIARTRREQIIVAAVEIITEQGLHNLSLSRLETRAGMKRGQLTYYFPTKEDILLAVFDRLLMLLLAQLHDGPPPDGRHGLPNVWEMIQRMLRSVLSDRPPVGREFHALQHTFLAQIAHREDFRQKLAGQYAEWRNGMAAHWHVTAKPSAAIASKVRGQTVSSFVQALVHGLTVQLAADPDAFDRAEMLKLCVGVLAPLFTTPAGDPE